MAEWVEKLEGILSNPQAMEQIMSLAKSLEGGENSASPSASAPAPSPPSAPLICLGSWGVLGSWTLKCCPQRPNSSLKWVDRTIGAPLCSRPCGPL